MYSLLCDKEGRPISVEILPRNTADPNAFNNLVQRVRKCFGINRIIFVGDRGMNDRIRAHVFLCMLAYYVEWYMRDRLHKILFVDDDRKATQKLRRSVVAPAKRSEATCGKDVTLRTASGLATLNRNTVRLESSGAEFSQLTEATPLQRRVFEHLSTP